MTTPVVVLPDVELMVIEHLSSLLPDYWADDVTVDLRKPNPMPPHGFVWVRRVGGFPLNEVTGVVRITCDVYEHDDAHVHDLAAVVRALVHMMRGVASPPVYRVTVVGDGRSNDPDSDQPRWSLAIELAVRGTTLEPVAS